MTSSGNLDLNFSSGIPALDDVLHGILPGDNVVLKVDVIEEFIPFAHRFAHYCHENRKDLIYFRYAQHDHLIPKDVKAHIYELSPEKGFENFISQIISVIEEFGRGACYIFDSLSDLSVGWYSDVMLSNFFMLTCPYLFKFDTVAYFAVFRNRHHQNTITHIQNTAQVVLDIYENSSNLYIRPVKVYNRYSQTLYMLHKWYNTPELGEVVKPVRQSAIIAKTLEKRLHPWLDATNRRPDFWHITFNRAQETLEGILLGEISPVQAQTFKNRLLQMAIVRDDLLFILAVQYLELEDLLEIGKRLIGTGFIGGKSVGMILAQAILRKTDPKWNDILEPQDSFFIGSEVFYTYLVVNDCWWMRRKLSHHATFLEGVEATQQKILSGEFPDYIIQQFQSMLEYFGQSPIIVRSSSLQEDAYGNSFSGKYESIFLANQGPPEERLKNFLQAIKTVYASTISRDALTYRKSRGLLESDEQMAILVQRVSGAIYGDYFMPQAAGVGFSFNPYVWDHRIDPKAGVLRLVLGLGTRAVDRTDDDYTRVVALSNPKLRVEDKFDDIRNNSQQRLDVLDLRVNRFITYPFRKLLEKLEDFPIEFFAIHDVELIERMEKLGREVKFAWVLTFDNLLTKTRFTEDMRDMLRTLQNAYQCPVDIEFTVNFYNEKDYNINLLQCRPFQIKREIKKIESPGQIDEKDLMLATEGPIIGTSLAVTIDRIIYVVPSVYGKLPIRERHAVARLIGKINQTPVGGSGRVLLLGPGRWGTSSPSLGIPVNFAEINNVSIIGEMAEMHEGLIPDLSLGTHFFNNLVELDMLYFAIHPEKANNFINRALFEQSKNRLTELLSGVENWKDAIKVIDVADAFPNKALAVNFNTV
ncbi:MAG: PEP/pyruvate-binding domain-containing protein, partial [Promethearchaeota archaeon]